MIKIENLSKSFSSVSVLKNISFSCPDKGLVLIEGENGSGKTTLFDILSLLDGSFDGKYTYFGRDVRTMKEAEKARIRKDEISYVFQKRNLVRYLSKEENLSFRRLVEGEKPEESSDKDWRTMSQGQLEKLALEEGLRPGRKVYLLDEVTAHLDSASQKETVKRIKELSKTSLVLIICHDLDLREVADAVWEIRKGELFLSKGFLPVEKTVPSPVSIRPKKKKRFPFFLMWKKAKKNAPLLLLQFLLFSFLLCIGWNGIFACKSYPIHYLQEAAEREPFLFVEADKRTTPKDILQAFPGETYVEYCSDYLVYSDQVPDDNKIHCNAFSKEYYRSTLRFLHYDVEVDDSIKTNLLFIYGDKNVFPPKRIPSSEGSYFFTSEENLLNHDGHPGFFYFGSSDTTMSRFQNRKNYEECSKKKVPCTLEDGVFYVGRKDLETKGKEHFDYVPSSYIQKESEVDWNTIFPEGVKATYVPGLDSSWGVLVSDSTMDKLFAARNFPTEIVFDLSKNRKKMVSYVSWHSLLVSSSSHAASEYNGAINCSLFISNQYSNYPLIYGAPVFVLLLEAFFFTMEKIIQKEDDRILLANGMSSFQVFLTSLIPSLLTVFLSILGGLGLVVGFLHHENLTVAVSPIYGALWSLAILVLTGFVSYLSEKAGGKRHD